MSPFAKPKNPYSKHRRMILDMNRADRDTLFGIERWFLIALTCLLMCLPGMVIRLVGGCFGYRGRKVAVDLWVLFKPAVLLTILIGGFSGRLWAAVIAAIALVDLYTYLLGLVFLKRYYTAPASYGRSVLAMAINFAEASLGFAVLYIHTGSIARGSAVIQSWGDAAYFSIITAATVGYGDIVPINPVGRALVVTQVLTALLFIAVVLSTFVSNLSLVQQGASRNELNPASASHPSYRYGGVDEGEVESGTRTKA